MTTWRQVSTHTVLKMIPTLFIPKPQIWVSFMQLSCYNMFHNIYVFWIYQMGNNNSYFFRLDQYSLCIDIIGLLLRLCYFICWSSISPKIAIRTSQKWMLLEQMLQMLWQWRRLRTSIHRWQLWCQIMKSYKITRIELILSFILLFDNK